MADTIYALATAPGRAGVAVIRISGSQTARAIEALTRLPLPKPRSASLRRFVDFDDETIDEGLLLWFPAPASFTGEDVAELHVHGGRAIVERLFGALTRVPGLRLAARGEFTRRAVEKGKLDLTRAEAIADLVDAETEAQRRQAVALYDGGLYELAEGWRAELIKALAWAEASIDFAEDEVPDSVVNAVEAGARQILEQMQQLLSDGRRGEILREGFHLTVIGPPNAGKSSLINALARRDIAIVSEIPGTTRDVIEARLDLNGYPVIVADTAGLRPAAEAIEAEGVRRAEARARVGDATLLLLDGTSMEPFAGISEDIRAHADLVFWNKADLAWRVAREGHRMSLKTGEGIDSLVESIVNLASQKMGRDGSLLTRARHREAISEAGDALGRALRAESPELKAEDLRLSLRAIGRLTGQVDVEDLLDVIFRDFCIGK